MIINSNLSALNALGNLNKNEMTTTSSLGKISSGLRINRAADDAAGLSISEKMKAQIRGLNQAQRNVQDGVSLAGTAEAGLGQIENPNLQRMRELAVQAANGTLSSNDREVIQQEFEQIKKSINDIARYTHFNNISLLAPSLIANENGSNPLTQVPIDVVLFLDTSGTMANPSGSSRLDLVKQGLDSFFDSMSTLGDVQIAFVNETPANPNDSSAFTNDKTLLKSTLNDYINHLNGHNTSNQTQPYGTIESAVPTGSIGSTLGYRADSKKVFVLLTDAQDESGVSNQLAAISSVEGVNVVAGYDSDDIQTFVMGFGGLNSSLSDYLQIVQATGGKSYDNITTSAQITQALSNDLSKDIASNIGNSNANFSLEEGEFATLQLQVGANTGNQFAIKLFDARTTNLGIADAAVDPFDKAVEAIDKIDNAIQVVSKQRAKFGNYQNALKYIASNVGYAEENLTAAESHIRDIDMAKEMMQLKKNDIISQAAQAMLAQANQQPQGVLQLLR